VLLWLVIIIISHGLIYNVRCQKRDLPTFWWTKMWTIGWNCLISHYLPSLIIFLTLFTKLSDIYVQLTMAAIEKNIFSSNVQSCEKLLTITVNISFFQLSVISETSYSMTITKSSFKYYVRIKPIYKRPLLTNIFYLIQENQITLQLSYPW
jgi:hypothetical protein